MLNVTTTQQNITLDVGSTITLECKVKFTEAEDIWTFWLFNGRLLETMPLQNARGNKILSNTVKEHIMSLELEHAKLNQSGTYTCGANSTAIQSAQNISVSVHDVFGPKLEQTDSTVQITNGMDLLKTTLFTALGFLVGITPTALLIKLWYRRRNKPPASCKSTKSYPVAISYRTTHTT